MVNSYKDLIVHQKAHKLAVEIYQATWRTKVSGVRSEVSGVRSEVSGGFAAILKW
jgi:hypothetical protein